MIEKLKSILDSKLMLIKSIYDKEEYIYWLDECLTYADENNYETDENELKAYLNQLFKTSFEQLPTRKERLKKDKINKTENIDELKILSDAELLDYTEKECNWIVEHILKSGGIIVVAGKRAVLKSWLMLNLGYSVCNGIDFLKKFKTSKGAVLYLDRENQFSELKIRARMIKNSIDVKESDIYFISESYIKIDRVLDIKKLEKIITEKKIKLVICDVYRRLISFDENDAKLVSALFVDLLKPLTERTGDLLAKEKEEKARDRKRNS